ncbi:hypothetical protein QR680_007955 [Steinernema hermaphroditum]|uniref:Uncharacterized protein n=1 Tax=Steinernema hermaphroditum TaxID=289476 RepID=A0AA39M6Z4_9BILA|nr:hypothetical protein QR680_007955 [Steinernema hermaphroditum]
MSLLSIGLYAVSLGGVSILAIVGCSSSKSKEPAKVESTTAAKQTPPPAGAPAAVAGPKPPEKDLEPTQPVSEEPAPKGPPKNEPTMVLTLKATGGDAGKNDDAAL